MIKITKEIDVITKDMLWGGAVAVWERVEANEMEQEVSDFIAELYSEDGQQPTMTQLNDFIWFDLENHFASLED